MSETSDAELIEFLSSARCCFWFGLAPCPKCGGDHGDPKCSPEKDQEFRAAISKAKGSTHAD